MSSGEKDVKGKEIRGKFEINQENLTEMYQIDREEKGKMKLKKRVKSTVSIRLSLKVEQ